MSGTLSVFGFTWIAGSTVAHVAEHHRRGSGTDASPWTYGFESICRYHAIAPYEVDGFRCAHYSRDELPAVDLPWCSACAAIVSARAAGWAEAGLLDPSMLPPPR